MEEKFGINITDDESLKIQSVLDAIQIMHSNYKTKLQESTEVAEDKSTKDTELKKE